MLVTRRSFTRLAAGLSVTQVGRSLAQPAPRVIIATYAGLGTKSWKAIVTERYTQQTGVVADVFESALPAASIAQAEGRPQFNVAVIAAYQAARLVNRGLIQLLKPEDIPGIQNVPKKLWPVTPDGQLIGMPVYFGLFGVAYNTQLAAAADFRSWNNLLDKKWKGQLSISRANFLAAYDVNLYAKLHGGDENNLAPGYDFLRKLIPQALNVYSSMASVEAQLGRGEVTAAPFYANEITMLRRGGTTEVDMRIPDEGGLVLPYLLVIPKGGPDPEAARGMVNAIIEPQYQSGFSRASLVWPMNAHVELPADLQTEMGMTADQAQARNVTLDWWTVGSNLEAETRKIDAMLQDVR
jgi:putative spermidine/putrescine transport system substrate-binding protein